MNNDRDFVSEALFKNATGKFTKISDLTSFGKSLLICMISFAKRNK